MLIIRGSEESGNLLTAKVDWLWMASWLHNGFSLFLSSPAVFELYVRAWRWACLGSVMVLPTPNYEQSWKDEERICLPIWYLTWRFVKLDLGAVDPYKDHERLGEVRSDRILFKTSQDKWWGAWWQTLLARVPLTLFPYLPFIIWIWMIIVLC